MTRNYHALHISSNYQKYAPCLFQIVGENTSMEGGEMRERKRMRERERALRAQVYFVLLQNTLVDTLYCVNLDKIFFSFFYFSSLAVE